MSKKRNGLLKNRLIAAFLSLAMMTPTLSSFTASAAELSQEEILQLYEQMLELGIVDEDGRLIEDNVFYDENGKVIAQSLTEMREFIANASDKSMMVYVGAPDGMNVTLEHLEEAIAIEDLMAQITHGLEMTAINSGLKAEIAAKAAALGVADIASMTKGELDAAREIAALELFEHAAVTLGDDGTISYRNLSYGNANPDGTWEGLYNAAMDGSLAAAMVNGYKTMKDFFETDANIDIEELVYYISVLGPDFSVVQESFDRVAAKRAGGYDYSLRLNYSLEGVPYGPNDHGYTLIPDKNPDGSLTGTADIELYLRMDLQNYYRSKAYGYRATAPYDVSFDFHHLDGSIDAMEYIRIEYRPDDITGETKETDIIYDKSTTVTVPANTDGVDIYIRVDNAIVCGVKDDNTLDINWEGSEIESVGVPSEFDPELIAANNMYRGWLSTSIVLTNPKDIWFKDSLAFERTRTQTFNWATNHFDLFEYIKEIENNEVEITTEGNTDEFDGVVYWDEDTKAVYDRLYELGITKATADVELSWHEELPDIEDDPNWQIAFLLINEDLMNEKYGSLDKMMDEDTWYNDTDVLVGYAVEDIWNYDNGRLRDELMPMILQEPATIYLTQTGADGSTITYPEDTSDDYIISMYAANPVAFGQIGNTITTNIGDFSTAMSQGDERPAGVSLDIVSKVIESTGYVTNDEEPAEHAYIKAHTYKSLVPIVVPGDEYSANGKLDESKYPQYIENYTKENPETVFDIYHNNIVEKLYGKYHLSGEPAKQDFGDAVLVDVDVVTTKVTESGTAREKAPEVKDIYIPGAEYLDERTFTPGSEIPIIVEFTEPVKGSNFALIVNQIRDADGNIIVQGEGIGEAYMYNISLYKEDPERSSNKRMFTYKVKDIDGASVNASELYVGDQGDISGNPFIYETPYSTDGNRFITNYHSDLDAQIGEGLIQSVLIDDLFGFSTIDKVVYASTDETATITVDIEDDYAEEYETPLANIGFSTEINAVLIKYGTSEIDDGYEEIRIPMELDMTDESDLKLVGTIDLDSIMDSDTEHVLYSFNLEVDYGDVIRRVLYTQRYFAVLPERTITEGMVSLYVDDGGDLLDIDLDESWPSGIAKTVDPMDETLAKLGHTDLYQLMYDDYPLAYDVLYYVSESPSIVDVGSDGTIIPRSVGTAVIHLYAENDPYDTDDDLLLDTVNITVAIGANASEGLLIHAGANTFATSLGSDASIGWANTLEGDDGDITIELFEGNITDLTGLDAVASYTVERNATVFDVPADDLTDASIDGKAPNYTVRISATASDGRTVSTVGYIVVRALPAVVRIGGDIENNTYFTSEDIDGEIGFSVTVDNLTNTGDYQISVTKNGESITDQITTDESAHSGSIYRAAYTIPVSMTTESLRDVYVIEARAKNSSDPSWSFDSRTVYVYRSNALSIIVNGEDAGDDVTLKNTVEDTEATTSPTIYDIDGKQVTGGSLGTLSSAEEIAALRGRLALTKTISINYEQYEWGTLTDTIKWEVVDSDDKPKTDENGDIVYDENGEVVIDKGEYYLTLNYRQGVYHENIDNFSYEVYTPGTDFMLSGIKETGEDPASVTATHSRVPTLTDTVNVSVERLYNKLYLFQFLPTITTEVTYTDALGNEKTVTTNPDGSLAIYEPNGFDLEGEIFTISYQGGVPYLGTYDVNRLLSGERDGASLQLYPLNTLELRKAGEVTINLVTPSGKPYSGQVVVRGGMYIGGEFIPDAKFGKPGETANLDGTKDNIFTVDDGSLELWFDPTQFVTSDGAAVNMTSSLVFAFELQFGDNRDEYYPELIFLNGKMMPEDILTTAANQIDLRNVEGEAFAPFMVTQSVDYYTGRLISTMDNTTYIGPSANYPQAALYSTAMLWNVKIDEPENENREFIVKIADQYDVESEYQTSEMLIYPFSSFALLLNELVLDHGKLWWENTATENRSIRLNVYEDLLAASGSDKESLQRIYDLPQRFKIVDMYAVTEANPIHKDQNVLSVMTNIAAWGSLYGADSQYGILNKISDAILDDGFKYLTEISSKVGLVKAVMSPTSDPTRFTGYFWTGINTTQFEDLNYDNNFHFEWAAIIDRVDDVAKGDYGRFGIYNGDTIEFNDTMNLNDMYDMVRDIKNGEYDMSELYQSIGGMLGLPQVQLEGWFGTEIRYNFDKMEWEVLMTDGGFTAGAMLEHEFFVNAFKVCTFSVLIRGGVRVDMAAAMRYAEQLGLEWNDTTAKYVNDFLTSLRIHVYIEGFAGLGYANKKVQARIGFYGGVSFDLESKWLTRKYLKEDSLRDLSGQYLEVDGELGVRIGLGAGPFLVELTLASTSFRDGFFLNDYKKIQEYWDTANNGLTNTQPIEGEFGDITYSLLASSPMLMSWARTASDSGYDMVKIETSLEDRSYLENHREWLGGEAEPIMTRRTIVDSSDADHLLTSDNTVQTNAYPSSNPVISDDGRLLVYISDGGSADVADKTVSYSAANAAGQFPEGTSINTGTRSYGDSDVDLDGSFDFAAAAWIRLFEDPNGTEGAYITEDDINKILDAQEVVAAIWNGSEWSTVRITSDNAQDTMPVIAVDEDTETAIVVWCSGSQAFDATGVDSPAEQDRILYSVYKDGVWSEVRTLNNGTEGTIKAIDVEMIGAKALVTYSLDTGTDTADSDMTARSAESGYEVYAALVNTLYAANDEGEPIELTMRLTNDTCEDAAPKLTTTFIDGEKVFVLGWNSLQKESGVEIRDLRIVMLNVDGKLRTDIPDSLTNALTLTGYNGLFTFAKGSSDIENLTVIYGTSSADNTDTEDSDDKLYAIKFGDYGAAGYGVSAPVLFAEMPEDSTNAVIDHVEAFVSDPYAGKIKSVLLVKSNTDEIESKDVYIYSEDADGNLTYEIETYEFPKTRSDLYTAVETLGNDFSVSDVGVDYANISTTSPMPISFTVNNMGIDTLDRIEVTFEGHAPQSFDVNVLPGDSVNIAPIYNVGDTVTDVNYTMTAYFDSTAPITKAEKIHLNYTDIGISRIKLTSEADGLRHVNITLYDNSAANIDDIDGRYVILSVYENADGTLPIDGSYFVGGTADTPYQIALKDPEILQKIDGGSYVVPVDFKIGEYVNDVLGLDEIPAGGIPIYFRVTTVIDEEVTDIETGTPYTIFAEQHEISTANNQKLVTFDSLLARNNNAPTTITTVQSVNAEGNTTATVKVQNNSLAERSGGNLVVSLLDDKGDIIEIVQSAADGSSAIDLGSEGMATRSFSFTKPGAKVIVSYSVDNPDPTDASLSTVSLGGTVISVTDDVIYAPKLPAGRYTLTAAPSNILSTVTVDGEDVYGGVVNIELDGDESKVYILVTAPDGNQRMYELVLGGKGEWHPVRIEYTTDNGKITVSETKVYEGDRVYVTSKPKDGYELKSLTAEDMYGNEVEIYSAGNDRYYFTMPDTAVVIRAGFTHANGFIIPILIKKGQEFDISAQASEGGSISPVGITAVKYGEDQSYSITPDEGYTIADVVVDGRSVGVLEEYTFTNVRDDHTISASFTKVSGDEPTTPVQPEQLPFTDVSESDWFWDDVRFVYENGLMNGTSESTFAPNINVTRAMMVTVLWRMEDEPVVDYLMTFEDIESGSYYEEAVRWAASVGIVNGYSAESFGPNDSITREQIAAIMYRYANYKGYDVSKGDSVDIFGYGDYADISAYAIEPMRYAIGSGLIKGKSADTLAPVDNATRAEISAILHRFIDGNQL